METSASMFINASKEQIWKVVTDIEGAKDRISCIKSIEILEKPRSGLVGLKWKETREMFGKEAEETMWITEAKENQYYTAEAINAGCLYHSTVALIEKEGGVELKMSFKATPQTLLAKLMSPAMFFMKGFIKKAYIKDLEDINEVISRQ